MVGVFSALSVMKSLLGRSPFGLRIAHEKGSLGVQKGKSLSSGDECYGNLHTCISHFSTKTFNLSTRLLLEGQQVHKIIRNDLLGIIHIDYKCHGNVKQGFEQMDSMSPSSTLFLVGQWQCFTIMTSVFIIWLAKFMSPSHCVVMLSSNISAVLVKREKQQTNETNPENIAGEPWH